MLKPALQLKLGQQLTMTPQLQQAIRLLQLPVLELQAQVQEALETNVMLEAEEDEQLDLGAIDQPAPEGEREGGTESGPEDDDVERDEPEEVVVEMEDPWAESSTPSGDGRAQDDDDRPLEFTDERERDLHQHLVWQLEVSKLDPRQVWIGEAIVDALNDDGYLTESCADIARSLSADLPVDEADVEEVLAFVQTLDPTGVGARSASECICLQLAQLEPDTQGRELALRIARDHLQAVADRDTAELRRSCGADEDTLLEALALIRACNPRPGSAFEGAQPEYIVPDVFVRRTEQGWAVEINPASVPRLRVNQGYASVVSRSADYATLRAQLQEARWLIRSLEIRNDTLLEALALIRACNPRPGSAFEGAQPEYIVPDVFVRRTEQGWSVEINPASVPRLRVNQGYASVVSRSADYATLRAQLQEARWLIRSLEIRNDTLLKVARSIVQRQAAFLEKGDEAMQPMILRDVAEAVSMHESTISRVTTGKYMHTPRGIYEFRYFFSSHVSGADGEDVSSVAIRARIRKLIADEDPGKALSDAQLAEILSREGVKVARRTVAKYREAMGLASSSERRHAVARARA